jgi:hypothetical protein
MLSTSVFNSKQVEQVDVSVITPTKMTQTVPRKEGKEIIEIC